MARSAKPKPLPARKRKPRSKERYEERRQEVVDIAARVFAERGFHATSIDDLVEATGLQRGGLYHYMDGKKELLIDIHARFIEPLLAEGEKIVKEGDSPPETLRKLARALMGDIAAYPDQVTVFLNEWRTIEGEPEWKTILKHRRRFEKLIEGVLKEGVDQGIFEISDTRNAVLGWLGMINYSYTWFRPGGRTSPTAVADQFCEIFLTGVQTD
jgi:AcrR family transcriptional regulator